MKTSLRALTVSLVAAALQSSSPNLCAEMRAFTSITGTVIRGELDTINGDMVTIKKEDGKFITTKAGNFSTADLAYLSEHGLKQAGGSSALASATKEKPFVNSLGMKFVPVPGTDVLFCTTLTRVLDYNAFAAQTPSVKPAKGPGDKKRDDNLYPVISSWSESKAFCDWLSKKEGRSYRLPTDREWSFAVGIGEKESKDATPEELNCKLTAVYPWGSQWPPPDGFANYADDSLKAFCKKINYTGLDTIKGYKDGEAGTSPVLVFKPNRLGIFDMGGNLWQWCEDWYDAAKTKRCLRGGEWTSYTPATLLSSSRLAKSPDFQTGDKTEDVGFRCVLEVTGP